MTKCKFIFIHTLTGDQSLANGNNVLRKELLTNKIHKKYRILKLNIQCSRIHVVNAQE